MIARIAFLLTFIISVANASPVDPGQVRALDGDTIRVAVETIRLVGFDALGKNQSSAQYSAEYQQLSAPPRKLDRSD